MTTNWVPFTGLLTNSAIRSGLAENIERFRDLELLKIRLQKISYPNPFINTVTGRFTFGPIGMGLDAQDR